MPIHRSVRLRNQQALGLPAGMVRQPVSFQLWCPFSHHMSAFSRMQKLSPPRSRAKRVR
jgi:hypothetical protein